VVVVVNGSDFVEWLNIGVGWAVGKIGGRVPSTLRLADERALLLSLFPRLVGCRLVIVMYWPILDVVITDRWW